MEKSYSINKSQTSQLTERLADSLCCIQGIDSLCLVTSTDTMDKEQEEQLEELEEVIALVKIAAKKLAQIARPSSNACYSMDRLMNNLEEYKEIHFD